ncbi:leukocyte cell-derived chemotaxin-2 [Labeo rohita]|uniref:leukocyte cell-derived chemotaxin-2 n=1 Tax=Labeo rohita TaxID=84645 RepID=UPI0021E24479|nr:leukocyte cell-derived chemotaxin-2 [Labeo rohita]
MRLYILFGFLLLAVICSCGVDASQVKFGPLCSGNPSNHIRECDKKGCGAYGAPRNNGKGKHEGLDIVCADGATVFAPFDVKLNGKAVPYRVNNAINDGVNLSGGGLCFKLFYVKPIKYSGTLKKGQKIGTLLPMQKVYPGITSHVHVQMCDRSDPTKYF